MERESGQIAVIGGGASGCLAAVAAARAGCTVFLLEKNEKLGRKLYATGNGRCNLTNKFMDESCYHCVSPDVSSRSVLNRIEPFSVEDLIRFFGGLGVPVHERDGYVYPRTDQAETVVRALEKAMRNLGIHVMTGTEVREIRKGAGTAGPGRFTVIYEDLASSAEHPADRKASDVRKPKQKTFHLKAGSAKERAGRVNDRLPAPAGTGTSQASLECDAVILCTGGLAGPSFGCSGDGYRLARAFSHRVTALFPSLTQLVCGCPWLKRAAGVRCHASVCLTDRDGQVIPGTLEDGEVQMTDYGISGIPVFQISGRAARYLAEKEKIRVRIDFLPEYTDQEFEKEISWRMGESRDQMLSDLLLGLANKKVIDLLLASEGLQAEMKARRLSDADLTALLRKLRAFDLEVTDVRSFENAQVTSGGIPLAEISSRFESVLCPGLYLAGELLDVDGRCGGYNLQWAMSSGYQAGQAAASSAGI